MTGNGFYRKGWLLPLLIFCGVATLAGVIALFVWQVGKNKDTQRSLIAANHRAIVNEKYNRRLSVALIRFGNYIFCRSEGRTPRQCKLAGKAVLLPPQIDIQKLTADFAKLGEARITKLMVGPPGRQGTVGAGGTRGARGLRGAQGADGRSVTGPMGPRGPQGQKGDPGARGATGPQGSQGSQGPAGPPGIVCPGLHIVTVFIPSSGTYKVPVCP